MKQPSLQSNEDEFEISRLSTALVTIFLILPCVTAFGPSHYSLHPDLAGNYCSLRANGKCCKDRDDPCSVPIRGTLCYCDEFCENNGEGHEDCCPDYWTVCKPQGDQPVNGSPGSAKACNYMNNCNRCKCTKDGVKCEQNLCLVEESLLKKLNVNERSLGWTATNYSQFWGKKLDEGLLKLTGTFKPDQQTLRMYPIRLNYFENQLPRSFDARRKWSHLRPAVRDQGWCASSWAFSTVAVVEDRLAIASRGSENVQLSTQSLVSCNRRGQKACEGGYVERAWYYFRKIGVVTEDCYPYESGINGTSTKCKIDARTPIKNLQCPGKKVLNVRIEKYTTEPAYRIASKEGDIMWEIMTNGPVQALMQVYQDFIFYKDGVYSRTGLDSGVFSDHSVKLIGWGEEISPYGHPTKYWLATNSWGPNWGLGGTFKIRRGTNEAGIENFIVAVRPHLRKQNQSENPRRIQSMRNGRRTHFKYQRSS